MSVLFVFVLFFWWLILHVSVPMLVFDSESLAVAHVILEIVCNGGWPFYFMDVSVIQDGYGCKLIDVDSFV